MSKSEEFNRVSQVIELWEGPRNKYLLSFDSPVKPGFHPWCKILYKENESKVRIELNDSSSGKSICGKYRKIASFKRKDHRLIDYKSNIVVSMLSGNGYFKKA